MSLRSSSQQPPVKYVKCDRLQPRIELGHEGSVTLRAVPLGHVADTSGIVKYHLLLLLLLFQTMPYHSILFHTIPYCAILFHKETPARMGFSAFEVLVQIGPAGKFFLRKNSSVT